MNARRSFTTSFGRTIPFIEGYLEAHARNPWEEHDWSEKKQEEFLYTPMTYSSFRKDLVEYAIARDFLLSIGVKNRWGSALDIGGREATVARLLNGEGAVDDVETIDFKPYYRRLTTEHFRTCMRDVFAPRKWGVRVPRRLAGMINPRYYNWAESQAAEFGFVPHRYFGWDIKMGHQPELGTYTIGDFNTHPFNRTFDYISAMCCFDYFDPDEVYPRIASLLNPGGVFIFLMEYWWYPVTTTDIPCHFPYAAQRLTREDFVRYLDENFPSDEAAWILRRRDYYHKGKQFTPHLHADVADRSGLAVLGERRSIPLKTFIRRTSLPPHILDAYENTKLSDVMEDIRQFRDDVSFLDLQSNFLMMAFMKRPPRMPDVAERIRQVPRLR